MNPEQLQSFKDEIREHLADTVRTVVNGKIDKIDRKLDLYIVDDTAWKVRAEPVVKAFENTSWLWKIFIGALKTIGLLIPVGGALVAIKKFLL